MPSLQHFIPTQITCPQKYRQILLSSQRESCIWAPKTVTHTSAARLAQSVEHETLNLRVVGSSPTLGANLFGPFFEAMFAKDETKQWPKAKGLILLPLRLRRRDSIELQQTRVSPKHIEHTN